MIRLLILTVLLVAGCAPPPVAKYEGDGVETHVDAHGELQSGPLPPTDAAPSSEAKGWPVPDPADFTPMVAFHCPGKQGLQVLVSQETHDKLLKIARLESLQSIDRYDSDGRPFIEFAANAPPLVDAREPSPKLGAYSPDENGTAAYLRDLDAWERRNPAK